MGQKAFTNSGSGRLGSSPSSSAWASRASIGRKKTARTSTHSASGSSDLVTFANIWSKAAFPLPQIPPTRRNQMRLVLLLHVLVFRRCQRSVQIRRLRMWRPVALPPRSSLDLCNHLIISIAQSLPKALYALPVGRRCCSARASHHRFSEKHETLRNHSARTQPVGSFVESSAAAP